MAAAPRFLDVSLRGPYADFKVQGVDLAIVNALRRVILSRVQTAAFAFASDGPGNDAAQGVEVLENTSVLHNELLGDRVSLVPMHLTEEETLDVAEGRAAYEFVLDVRNGGSTPRDVTTADFTGTLNGEDLPPDALARIFPADPVTRDHVLLVRLKPAPPQAQAGDGFEAAGDAAERVHLTCRPTMGCGQDHARWCPVSVCSFGNVVDEVRAATAKEEELAAARAQGASLDELARIAHDFEAMGRQRCFVVDEYNDPAQFTFRLRSECGLRPAYVVFRGLAMLRDRMAELAELIAAAGPPPADGALAEVTLEPYGGVRGMFQITLQREDHTFGNLIQACMFNSFIRGVTTELEYIGYHKPHPLEDHIVVRIKLAEDADPASFMSASMRRIAAGIGGVAAEWAAVSGLSAASIRDVDALIKGALIKEEKPVEEKQKRAPRKKKGAEAA